MEVEQVVIDPDFAQIDEFVVIALRQSARAGPLPALDRAEFYYQSLSY